MTITTDRNEAFARACAGKLPVLFIGHANSDSFELVSLSDELQCAAAKERAIANGQYIVAAVSLINGQRKSFLTVELDATAIASLSAAYSKHIEGAIQEEFEALCTGKPELIQAYREHFNRLD